MTEQLVASMNGLEKKNTRGDQKTFIIKGIVDFAGKKPTLYHIRV